MIFRKRTYEIDVMVALGENPENELRVTGYAQVDSEARINPQHPQHAETIRALGCVAESATTKGLQNVNVVRALTYSVMEGRPGVKVVNEDPVVQRIKPLA